MHTDHTPQADPRAARSRVLRRALPPLAQRWPGLAFGVLADGAVVGLMVLSMWLIVRAAEQPPILHLTFAVVGVRALAIGRAAFRYLERLASHQAALTQLAELRTASFAALVPRVPGALDADRRGDILATFVDDIDQLQDEALRVRGPMIVSSIVVTLSVLLLALASPVAAAILAATLIVVGVLSAWISVRIAGRSDRALAAARADLTDRLLERFAAADVLTAYDALGQQRADIAESERALDEIQVRRSRAAGVTGALVALGGLGAALGIFSAVAPIVGDEVSAPLFAALVIVPVVAFEVFAQVPQALVARRTVQASAERVADLTERELPDTVPVDAQDASDDVPADTTLVVEGIEATYPGRAVAAVRDVSFTLCPGETLVITGESGSGKSTLALVLARLLEYRGSYRIGGVEARCLRAETVRRVVGLCEQSPHLFDSDLRQNLKFAREQASDEVLMAALARVGLDEWARARGGLDAAVGDRGALVSGGQLQRIALARVLLADFPVVILDEPTAGVDRDLADHLLTDLLAAVPADRSVILITHSELPKGITASRLHLETPVPRSPQVRS